MGNAAAGPDVDRVVVGMDPHKRSVTIEVIAGDETEESLPETSRHVYRRLKLPDSEIRVLLAPALKRSPRIGCTWTSKPPTWKPRFDASKHWARPYDHQQERGHDFRVLRDPWLNEFCVLQPEFPELLARRRQWTGLSPARGPVRGKLTSATTDE